MVDIMETIGLNMLMLYTEDTYEIKERPYFGYLRGRYTQEELREIDSYCMEHHVELIPCIQTLAHLNAMMRWREFDDVVDCNDILFVGEDKTYELIDDILKTVSKTFQTNIVHIGMDEAGMLGMGKYRQKNGYTNPKTIMKEHLTRVAAIAEKYGLQPLIWSDMLFQVNEGGAKNEISELIPECVTPVYWDYYSVDKAHYKVKIKEHQNLGKPFWYAGGLWTWTGFSPHNGYSIRECRAAIESCAENGVENIFFTMWGDNGAETSVFSVLPSIYYVSQLAKGIYDEAQIKQGFEELTGIAFDEFMLLDIPEITNSAENCDKTVNPDKYMLYNDYFLGIYDAITDGSKNQIYHNTASSLDKLTQNREYGYLFQTIQSLCNVLAVKNDLGIRTRKAYRGGDRETLQALLDDYTKTEVALNIFYENLKVQWYRENKPFGFEVQDARLGGLIHRTRSCRERIKLYLAGEIDCIEELEEEILDPECIKDENKREIWENAWNKSFIGTI